MNGLVLTHFKMEKRNLKIHDAYFSHLNFHQAPLKFLNIPFYDANQL